MRQLRVYTLGIPGQVQVQRAKTSWHDPNAVKALATIHVVGVRDCNVSGGGQSIVVSSNELPAWIGKVGRHFNPVRGIAQSVPAKRKHLLRAGRAVEQALSETESGRGCSSRSAQRSGI